jgi:hypothetical protein
LLRAALPAETLAAALRRDLHSLVDERAIESEGDNTDDIAVSGASIDCEDSWLPTELCEWINEWLDGDGNGDGEEGGDDGEDGDGDGDWPDDPDFELCPMCFECGPDGCEPVECENPPEGCGPDLVS